LYAKEEKEKEKNKIKRKRSNIKTRNYYNSLFKKEFKKLKIFKLLKKLASKIKEFSTELLNLKERPEEEKYLLDFSKIDSSFLVLSVNTILNIIEEFKTIFFIPNDEHKIRIF
tara:strand:- start:101 stop:439 length:339 start_codon:yes stop_codon:yes gene_type:complete